MTQSSRRVFLVLAGAVLLGAIAQRTKVLNNEEALLNPNPKNPLPTPTKRKAISSPPPTPTQSKSTTSPTPTNSPTVTPTPQATQTAATEGVVIAKSDDLVLRQTRVFSLKDSFGIPTSYSLTRTSRGIVAFDTRCTHAGAPCALNQGQLQCPAHGSIFDPENGEVLRGPAVEPLKSYRTLEVNGEIRIIIS
ncbi:MAG: Rieske 2Fe-2S domain-containing protein [Actinobacteria bacterium]|nr:Rieske 2Fe-2S domain-containing protein [Actinomycetota bacterium]